MADFTLEELQDHFGGVSLIGRITSLDRKKGLGLITAFRESDGEKWRYPDGQVVDDVLFVFEGDTKLGRNDWVLIQGYEMGNSFSEGGRPLRLRAIRVDPLAEIDGVRDILSSDSLTPARRVLAGAVRSVRVIGEKALILQSYLDSERRRIEREVMEEKARLENLAVELARKQEDIETEKEMLVLKQEELKQEETALSRRLRSYGLDMQSITSGKIKLSSDLIGLLMEQEPIREAVMGQRLEELSQLEREIAVKGSALEEQEQRLNAERDRLAVKEAEIVEAQQRLKQKLEANTKLEQSLQELRAILTPARTVQAETVRTAPVHRFESEKELLTHVKRYVKESGFFYDAWVIEDFYTCLKIDYLTILSGISGSGKSRLPCLFAEAIGGAFELIPVRPDWNDDRDLVGFFDFRRRRYQSTRFVEFLLKANADQNRLHIVCLDEMNLAPVEYYFAQLLSVLETTDPHLRPPDESLTEEVIDRLQEATLIEIEHLGTEHASAEGIEREAISREVQLFSQLQADLEKYWDISIPKNIRFVGTVNVDHTTHGFSDKVLDRANVIQFERVNLGAKLRSGKPAAKGLSYEQFAAFCAGRALTEDQRQLVDQFRQQVVDINLILEPGGIGIGFRVLGDIQRYITMAIQGDYFDDPKVAFDFQIKQRILPKIRGMQSKELKDALDELARYLQREGYTFSYEKVAGRVRDGRKYGGMIQQLDVKGYVNYWEIS